jgi:hypothetical protein
MNLKILSVSSLQISQMVKLLMEHCLLHGWPTAFIISPSYTRSCDFKKELKERAIIFRGATAPSGQGFFIIEA